MKKLMEAGYKPLPSYLTIKNSKIEGLGLFTMTSISKDTNLGMTHVKHHAEWIRTPLGGFYNHSDEPNCEKVAKHSQFKQWFELRAIKEIKEDEEITVSYTLYKIK